MDLVRLAKKLGYNDVTLQTELWQSLGFLGLWPKYKHPEEVPPEIRLQHACFEFIKNLNDSTGCLDEIKKMGMTFSLWTHEIEDYQPEWGPIENDNERLWKEIYNRYVYLCDTMLPQVDYIILTLAESRSWTSGYDMTLKTCKTVYEACKACDVKLIVRTFIYTDKQGDAAFKVFEELPDDVIVMSKYGPKDWNAFGIIHPYLGKYAPKMEILEDDIGGEYYKANRTAHCMIDYMKNRFDNTKEVFADNPNRFWGINIRVNRGFDPVNYRGSVYGEAQEADLWGFAYWATGKADNVEVPLHDWAANTFGDSLADVTAEIFRPTGKVVANSVFISSEPFGDTRKDVPAVRTTGGLMKNGNKKTLKKVKRQDKIEPIVDSSPFVQGRSNCINDTSWIPNLVKLVKGDPEIIAEKEEINTETILLANESLRKFQALKESLPEELFTYHEFKLKENIYLAKFYGLAGLAWLKASRRLYSDDEREKEKLLEQINGHLDKIRELEQETRNFTKQKLTLGNRVYYYTLGDYGYNEFISNFTNYFALTK